MSGALNSEAPSPEAPPVAQARHPGAPSPGAPSPEAPPPRAPFARALDEAARAVTHLLAGAALGLACLLMWAWVLTAAAVALTVVGAAALPETVGAVRRTAGVARRRTAAWTGGAVPEAYMPLDGGLVERVRTAANDPGTLRDLRWMAASTVYAPLLAGAALALWMPALAVDGVRAGLLRRRPVALPLLTRLADLEAGVSRALLLPAPEAVGLVRRVEQLAATRAGAVAAHGAELRRIERDLHDGAQAHLVALSMRIGLARRAYERDPDSVVRLLDEAQDQAEKALAELRHVVRGIHPPVLTDRGLVGAVRALAASSGLEVAVAAEGLADGAQDGAQDGTGGGTGGDGPAHASAHGAPAAARAPAAVEAAAYFVVAEALTNAAKHSGARTAAVRLARAREGLRVLVRDEGRGGADEGRGSGLLGMRRRVAALDGTMRLTSPAGGPTVIEVELPCVW